ncbi:phage head closure protein [Staphylococcus coagulans]|uniref:phage head closure protein n=1 Tax=Staphylococcus coagulans TaxID=74706 RepID=UPI003364DB16
MFNPYDEFPHVILMGHTEVVGRPPLQKEVFVSDKTIQGFMDTPTSVEQLQFHQMNKDYDRNLYTPYSVAIDVNSLFKYDGKIYRCAGEPVDQGGQHEINLTRLKAWTNGKS